MIGNYRCKNIRRLGARNKTSFYNWEIQMLKAIQWLETRLVKIEFDDEEQLLYL
jgi:hypothetical protein